MEQQHNQCGLKRVWKQDMGSGSKYSNRGHTTGVIGLILNDGVFH